MTTIALPALWLAARDRADDGAAAPVAAAGLGEAAGADEPSGLVPLNDPLGTIPAPPTEGTDLSGRFVQYETPTATSPILLADATFRRTVPRADVCLTNLVASGERITVINLDTGRSVNCLTRPLAADSADRLVMRTDAFASFADVTDAPIHVEIHVEP